MVLPCRGSLHITHSIAVRTLAGLGCTAMEFDDRPHRSFYHHANCARVSVSLTIIAANQGIVQCTTRISASHTHCHVQYFVLEVPSFH